MIIDSEAHDIRRTAEGCLQGAHTAGERLRTLFYFVRDEIAYTFAPQGSSMLSDPSETFRASATLARGSGMCIQKAALLCALARASGFRARLSFQALRDHRLPRELVRLMGSNTLVPHGLVSVELHDQWLRLDASLDGDLCRRKGYRPTEFSETQAALLPSTDVNGRRHFEVVEEMGDFDELPLDFVLQAFAERYAGIDFDAVRQYVLRSGATM
jgi:transglutaminase-like putative cysteine protease